MESEVPGSILTGGNILLLIFWVLRSKASDDNIANVVCLSKTRTNETKSVAVLRHSLNESSNTAKYRARAVPTRFLLVTALGPGRDGFVVTIIHNKSGSAVQFHH